MKQMTCPLLLPLISLATTAALAQERTPGPNIRDATWQQHRDYYQRSPLCSSHEVTLWTCEVRQRRFTLCASREVSRTSGYMQYRASQSGELVFEYPKTKRPPRGLLEYNVFANGDASIEFTNEGYRYSLNDPLRSSSFIRVSSQVSDEEAVIECGGNQGTLQVNYTMRLMYDAGLWPAGAEGEMSTVVEQLHELADKHP